MKAICFSGRSFGFARFLPGGAETPHTIARTPEISADEDCAPWL